MGIKQNEFIKFLLDKKYIYRDQRGKIMPYAKKNDGLFEVKECANDKTKWAARRRSSRPRVVKRSACCARASERRQEQ